MELSASFIIILSLTIAFIIIIIATIIFVFVGIGLNIGVGVTLSSNENCILVRNFPINYYQFGTINSEFLLNTYNSFININNTGTLLSGISNDAHIFCSQSTRDINSNGGTFWGPPIEGPSVYNPTPTDYINIREYLFQTSNDLQKFIFRNSTDNYTVFSYCTFNQTTQTFGTPFQLLSGNLSEIQYSMGSISPDGSMICVLKQYNSGTNFDIDIWSVENNLTSNPKFVISVSSIISVSLYTTIGYSLIDPSNSNFYILLYENNLNNNIYLAKINISDTTPFLVYNTPISSQFGSTSTYTTSLYSRNFKIADNAGFRGRCIFYASSLDSFISCFQESSDGTKLYLVQSINAKINGLITSIGEINPVYNPIPNDNNCISNLIVSNLSGPPNLYEFNFSENKWEFIKSFPQEGVPIFSSFGALAGNNKIYICSSFNGSLNSYIANLY